MLLNTSLYTTLSVLLLSWLCPGRSTKIITNFIWPYLHQFFDNSHSLNNYKKPSKRPFSWYWSCLEAINIG